MLLCTISILHLLAVSYDRFLVIVRVTADSPSRKRPRALILISLAWLFGSLIGLLPLMGWNKGEGKNQACIFMAVMDLSYLVFLYFATIIAPTFLMAFFYLGIYWKVHSHQSNSAFLGRSGGSAHQKRLESRRQRIILSLFIVIVSFLVGWYPLYTLNAITWFRPDLQIPLPLFFVSIILSHATSACNPLIYAYTMPGFSEGFKAVLCCRFGITQARYRQSKKISRQSNNEQVSMWNDQSTRSVHTSYKTSSTAHMLHVPSSPAILNHNCQFSSPISGRSAESSSPALFDHGGDALLPGISGHSPVDSDEMGRWSSKSASDYLEHIDFPDIDSQEEIML